MSDERFKNTNNMPNLKSFGDFLKWSLNRKRPAPVKIESSDEIIEIMKREPKSKMKKGGLARILEM